MRFLKKLVPFVIIAGAALLLLYLPDIGPERYTDLGGFFKTERKRQAYVGYAVAVVQDGSVLYVDAFGNDGAGKPLSIDSPLLLGSVSKTFTGLVTLSLQREKLVSIDAPVRQYLPWFGFQPAQGIGSGLDVSLRHLLSQTSGVSDRDFDDVHALAPDLESAVRSMQTARPRAPAGAKPQYIDSGYQAVALALESATKLDYADLVSSRILRPLGMDRSSASPAAVADVLTPGSGSFFGMAIPRKPAVPAFGAPSGYMVSTASDMAKYLAYLAGPEKVPRTPVPARYIRTLYEPLVESSPYTYGWRVSGEGADLEASHAGSLEGYSASITLWPGKRAGIVILAPQNDLLQSWLVAPVLVNGAKRIMFEGSSDRPFPIGRLYILLAVAAVVHLLALLLQTGGALNWSRDVRCRVEAAGSSGPLHFARARNWFGIAVRLAVASFVPLSLGMVFGRRVTWPMAFALEPSLASWLLAAVFFGVMRNVARLAWLRAPR
jgi:CubicO group peptidase (beta-lactamase class C family)